MITRELLGLLSAALADGKAARPGIDQAMRDAFPGVTFSRCDDNDIPSRLAPLASGEGFALYGIAGGAHCATLTADPESACGLVIAVVNDED